MLVSANKCSRQPLFTLSDAYALGPGLRRASIVN
jgi:hypothetical protein